MPKPVHVYLVRPEKMKNYTGALTELKKDRLKIALEELDKYGREQVKLLQTLAPQKKGLFASGFTYSVKKSGPKIGELRVNWYPKERPRKLLDWIVFGTGIYGPMQKRIVPKKKPFLAWQNSSTGKWMRAKSVRGMRPRNFVSSAWQQLSNKRSDLYEKIGKLIAQRIFDQSSRGGAAR
jgi:hypothetical protein